MKLRTRKRKPSLLLAVVAVLILLLPLLAYLQYDWLGKVSEREREQMRASLQHALSRFSEDFDNEISRIYREFGDKSHVDGSQGSDDLDAEYSRIFAHWRATAPYPKLVETLFIQKSGLDSVSGLRRLDRASGKWEQADWITEFGPNAVTGAPINTQIPALTIPVFAIAAAIQEPDNSDNEELRLAKALDSVIVRLDLEYIRTDFLPAFVRAHFSDISDYRIEIRDGQDHSNILYSSEPGKPMTGEGDASEELFRLRPQHMKAGVPAGFAFNNAAGIVTKPTATKLFFHDFVNVMSIDFVSNAWRVTAVHRSGSLDAAVNQLRHRNLVLSFSILTLLAASIAIVLASTARAQRLARQQMEFVSAVSHELRTPLAVIRSAGENLADGVVRNPDQLKSYGEVIRNEGRRLTEMVEQVLSFAGIQAGLKTQAFVRIDLADVVDRALQAFQIPIRESGFTIERSIPSDLPPVMGDAPALTRAVQNLISNALKYGADGRWIGVSIQKEGTVIKLAVQDRGGGILSPDLSHVFEPFYRGRPAVDGQIQGSGLGLSIVKQTVESHGGRIDVTSNPGAGCTFCMALPIALEPEIPSA